MSGYIPVTTHSKRLRHYAHPDDMGSHVFGGLSGNALCDKSIFTDVYDQDAVDTDHARLVDQGYKPKPVVIGDLPECKRCAKRLPLPDTKGRGLT